MRTKTTLFLLVLLSCLGLIAYYVLGKRVIDPEQDQQGILAAQEAAVLDYLKLEFRDRPNPIVLEKRGGEWRIVEPVLWPANRFAVDLLLSQLQFLKRVSSFPARELADYGLDPPEGLVTYGYGSVRKTLRVGKATDLERNAYLLPNDGTSIVVAKREVVDDLRRPLEELRSPDVFSVPLFEVRNWIVQIAEAGNLRVHLAREGEKWRLESPIPARADKAAVDTLLKRVLDLRVESFWREGAPDLNSLGLASPAFRITVVGSGNRESLLLGSPVPEQPQVFYAKREDNDTVFTVRVAAIDELRNAQVGLRDRRVVEFDPARLQSITLLPAGQPSVTLQWLETGAWQVVSRTTERGLVTMEGDPGVIGTLVQEIANLRAVRENGFVRDVATPTDLDLRFGLTGAAWQIQIAERAPAAGGETRVQTITLGRRTAPPGAPEDAPETLQYAMADEGFVYLVDRGLSDDLRAAPYHYRNRQLRQMASGETITNFTLGRLANNEIVLSGALASPDQTWPEALAELPPPQRDAALQLIGELRNLRAKEIIAPEFPKAVPGDGEIRPWTWLLEATVALEGGATQQNAKLNLYLDNYEGGTELLVGVPELGLVVAAQPALIDALRPFIFERPDPGVPPVAPSSPPEAETQPAPNAALPETGSSSPPGDSAPAPAPAAPSPTPPVADAPGSE